MPMQLLDTATVAPEHRVDAFRAAFDQASVPCRIEHLGPDARVHSRMHLWHFGSANLFTTDASGFRLVRTPRHLRMEAPPVVALSIHPHGRGRFSQLGHEQHMGPGRLMLNDLTAPYSWSSVSGGSRAVQIRYDHLDLPVDVVRRAIGRLPGSPVHDLLVSHLQRLAASADQLAADPGATAVGAATVELVRALVVSAADDDRLRRAVREESLPSRVREYVLAHLPDPDLSPASIAAAHNVSVRQLYKAFAADGQSLEQWVITERLELARAELASAAGRRRPIAATARACGFLDPSHFARRFRAAFGVSPHEWQQLAR
jgi:AraC-like DNA-binding protein